MGGIHTRVASGSPGFLLPTSCPARHFLRLELVWRATAGRRHAGHPELYAFSASEVKQVGLRLDLQEKEECLDDVSDLDDQEPVATDGIYAMYEKVSEQFLFSVYIHFLRALEGGGRGKTAHRSVLASSSNVTGKAAVEQLRDFCAGLAAARDIATGSHASSAYRLLRTLKASLCLVPIFPKFRGCLGYCTRRYFWMLELTRAPMTFSL